MDDSALKNALHISGLTQTDKLLILLLGDDGTPKKPAQLRVKGKDLGLRAIKDWNISLLFSRSKGAAIAVPEGWELTVKGRQHLAGLGITSDHVVVQQATALRKLLPKIKSEKNREFLAEAVSCFEHKNLRAASVLAWIGAVSLLYDHVFQHALAKVNAEWIKRHVKNKPVVTIDDFSDIKEFDFLDLIETAGVIGKNVKLELKQCLQFRNGCGHPNNLVVGETRVASHIETLINNVYQKF